MKTPLEKTIQKKTDRLSVLKTSDTNEISVEELLVEFSTVRREIQALKEALSFFLSSAPGEQDYTGPADLYPFPGWVVEELSGARSAILRSLDDARDELRGVIGLESGLQKEYTRESLIALGTDLSEKLSRIESLLLKQGESSETADQLDSISNKLARIEGERETEFDIDDIAFQLTELRSLAGERIERSENIYFWILIFLSMMILFSVTYIGTSLLQVS